MTATQNTMIWGSAPSTTCLKLWEYVSETSGQNVLILGVGDGRNVKFLASQNFNVFCVDPDLQAITKLSEWAKSENLQLTTLVCDYESCDFSGQFDIVLSVGAIRNTGKDSVENLFSKIRAATKPNGFNAISVFIEKPFISQEKSGLFKSGELMTQYNESMILWANQELFKDDTNDLHCVDRIIAKKIPEDYKMSPDEVKGLLSLV